MRKIAARDGIGDLLAEGTLRAALKISEWKGVNALRFAVQSKGIAIGAHGGQEQERLYSALLLHG